MSFRMRGQAIGAARNAATWLLIFSFTSSAVVMGAPGRRDPRRAKRNACCPQPATCSPCDECNSCQSGEILTSPSVTAPGGILPTPAIPKATAPKGTAPKAPAPENRAEQTSPMPPSPDPGPPAPAPVSTPGSDSPKTSSFYPNESSDESSNPVIVTEESPPTPSAEEVDSSTPARSVSSPKMADPFVEVGRDAPNEDFGKSAATPTIEQPKPADAGSRYQEYLDRYFDRKGSDSAPKPQQEKQPETTSPIDLDRTPTLSPSKPAKEYNDPFRPTSYRSSPERTWRDSSGQSRMKARFLGVDERGMAQMEREDGRLTRVPLANLSPSDQRFIELLAIRDLPTNTQAIASRPRGR